MIKAIADSGSGSRREEKERHGSSSSSKAHRQSTDNNKHRSPILDKYSLTGQGSKNVGYLNGSANEASRDREKDRMTDLKRSSDPYYEPKSADKSSNSLKADEKVRKRKNKSRDLSMSSISSASSNEDGVKSSKMKKRKNRPIVIHMLVLKK